MVSANGMGGRLLLAVAIVTVALAFPAAAQQVPTVGDHGPNIVVTMQNGGLVEGVLVTLDHASVTMLVNQLERTIPLTSVRRIEREGDGSGDGATKGAVILGLLCALVCGQGTTSGSQHMAGIAANAAIGALAGWQFDRGHRGRTKIYPPPVDWSAGTHATPPAVTPPVVPSEPATTPANPATPDTPEVPVAPDVPETPAVAVIAVKRHALSVSPFALAHGDGALEYERRVSSWLGIGLVAARSTRPSIWVGREQVAPEARQVLIDAVARVYPGGRVFSGAAFGLRAGVGSAAGDQTFGVGYDLAYTWQFDTRVYVSVGASQERAVTVGRGPRPARVFWPLTRLNVGVVF